MLGISTDVTKCWKGDGATGFNVQFSHTTHWMTLDQSNKPYLGVNKGTLGDREA